MKFDLVVQTEAILDMQEAFEWYEIQKAGLGDELISEIENCFQKLTEHPEYYTYINDKYRRIKTNRFPYLLIFEIEVDKVIINSFYHAKRKFNF